MKSKKVWTGALSSQSKRNLLILETIRRRGEVSLGLISQQTGLNIPTISNHLNNLSREKIIVEKGAVFTGGRPATLIELNPKVAYILGIGINLKSVVVVLINFKGEILERAKEKIEKEDIQEILKTAIRLGKKIVKKARLNEEDIQGVGVGVAGIVDYDNGLIHWPSKVGPTYVSIYLSVEEIVRKEFAPSVVVIENDATVAAFAEWWLYLPEIKNAIYIYSGVGCGIIINGELYRGASGSAGEISIYNPQSKETAFAAEGEHPFYRWD
ncbi:MAG: ROK family transcriptional regulator, partial [Candidatus Omnitrophica bacterium]|nr:ROK family transcriptional regulator [Candidatus Omnitrophota bacterium]